MQIFGIYTVKPEISAIVDFRKHLFAHFFIGRHKHLVSFQAKNLMQSPHKGTAQAFKAKAP